MNVKFRNKSSIIATTDATSPQLPHSQRYLDKVLEHFKDYGNYYFKQWSEINFLKGDLIFS